MDMKVEGFKQKILGAFVTRAVRGEGTGTWTGSPAFFYAGHYPNYGPTYPSLGFPYMDTLVDCLLHQMHAF